MADKQVNININYKVNTVEVQKAEQLLKQAQTASTTFENSAKKAATTTSTAFKQAGTSIQDMNARLTVLKERITQSSDPTKIKRLSDQYKQLKTQIDAANKSAFDTSKAIDQTSKSTQSLSGQLGGLYNAVKLAFTAGIIKEVATTALELTKLSGNVDGVSRAFNRTFANSTVMLENLRKSTHGTVSEFDLMQKALKAQNLGVPIQELGKLLEFAAVRAQQTGDSVDYLVNSIIDGLGRKSILKLDNLGISATRLKEAMGGVSLQAASVAQVTEAFTKVAGEELQKMGGYAETAATKVEQLEVSWKNLRIEFAKKVESGGFATFLKDVVDGLGMWLKGSEQVFLEQQKLNGAKDAERIIESQAFKDLGSNQQAKLDFLQQEANSRVQLLGRYNDNIKALKEERTEISNKNPYDDRIEQITKTIRGYNDNKFAIAATILALKSYIVELGKVNEKEVDQLGIIGKLKIEIDAFGKKIDDATSYEDIRRLNDELKVLQATLTDLQNSTNQFNPFASKVFDIKKNLSEGKVKLKPGDLIDTKSLDDDTTKLFNDLGKKQGEEFTKGLKEGVDRAALADAISARKEELQAAAIDITANSLSQLASMEADSYAQRLRSLSIYYDEQIMLAGDNDRAKDRLRLEEKKKTDKLRREEARKEQQARLYQILINTAAGIAKAFATSATIYDAYINAGLVAVEGAAQYAIASKGPKGFKDGVLNLQGPGTGKSDSISARLSKGESVMTAQEWQTSKNVLKEVRAKRLDDDVLQSLKLGNDGVKVVGGMDDKRMIAKLDEIKNSMPDVEARGHLLYTTKKKSDNYRMWVRKSSMSQ